MSRHIWDFIRFASLVLLAFGGIWALWKCRLSSHTLWLWFGAFLFVCCWLLVGILGMVWSLVEWLLAGVVAWRRAKASHGADLSHK
jgi:hypothetical protein